MGTLSQDKRLTETAKLYDYGYQKHETKTFYRKGETLPKAQTIQITNAKQKNIKVVLKQDIRLLIKPAEINNYTYCINKRP